MIRRANHTITPVMNSPTIPRQRAARFDPATFGQYEQLTAAERLFLRTCCYYPPRPRRMRVREHVTETDRYIATFERAFGPQLWAEIAGKTVLDFGCGEGGYTLALAEKGAGHVVGVDIVPEFRYAEEEAHSRDYAATFVDTGAESLADGAFDVVISHDSFEHFDQPEQILAEMTRLTRPGGLLLIKFGPPWRNPWGRHMSGTIRRDRPWVHLVVPERIIMRVQSVYHNEPVLKERYQQLPGGLNRMTVGRFKGILKQQPGIRIETLTMAPLVPLPALMGIPGLSEYFVAGVCATCRREGS